MVRTIAGVTGGAILGVLAMLVVARFDASSSQSPDEVIRDIVNVPAMAQAAAETHRDEQYVRLTSVEEVIALPTEFARSEALHVLAGRSDPAGVQNLIFEANRIANDIERVNLLNILFFRLAETDPQSALALARIDHFKGIKPIEHTVWRAWARKDFEDALFAAKTQTSIAHQNSAAQSIYAAYGYMENEMTDRIEAELGIGPDRRTRSRYLYQLADKSPAEAIAFINGLERDDTQRDYVSWLAYYVSLKDPAAALAYANLFEESYDGERYSSIINSNIAHENPQATVERILANGSGAHSSSEFYRATSELARTNLDAAELFFQQARSSDIRRTLGSAIVSELVKKDPAEALAWAREHDTEMFPHFQHTVLRRMAETAPQYALKEALNTPDLMKRSMMVSFVVSSVARRNPLDAVTFLDEISNPEQKLNTSERIASSWIRQDPDAAIDWIVSLDKETAAYVLRRAGSELVDGDIDVAIRLLPKLDEAGQRHMREQIALELASSYSLGEAQGFIQQFEGQTGYDKLQASLISGVAKTDVWMAKQLTDQLADGDTKDRAYAQVIAQYAQVNPAEAVRWLNNVVDERLRDVAAGQLAAQWYGHDPAAATQWVLNLPTGSSRDDAILQMSYQWRSPTAEQEDMIASIGDRDKRGQAKIRVIYSVMRTDPAKARKLLEDEDIPNYQRQQLETRLSQYGSRF